MNDVAAIIATETAISGIKKTIDSVHVSSQITATAVVAPSDAGNNFQRVTHLDAESIRSSDSLSEATSWFQSTGKQYLLLITGSCIPLLNQQGISRLLSAMDATGASVTYGDYTEILPDGSTRPHPLIDYQIGSIRDTFDFGPVTLLNGTLLKKSINSDTSFSFGALYNLRLRLSEQGPVVHLPEPLYSCVTEPEGSKHAAHFAYVDPRNRDYQIEMERIAIEHLKRTGAYIAPTVKESPVPDENFPVEASIIIPVRNRVKTISDAVKSALSQETTFQFNVIVVDNHSTDGTTDLLAAIAEKDSRLIHLIPEKTDLLIGGCWNEAIFSDQCGNYAVQLDSDDIYNGTAVLEQIVKKLSGESCALVIGSYTTVNFNLEELPPGLIDHREWTDDNGPNNALRIAGLGAPRAYHVPTLRQFGFPNVSYGEDYAAVLRLCRSYSVGRIYESLYWCRRWEENSDSCLPLETANRYDLYKDRLRSIEIMARISENRQR